MPVLGMKGWGRELWRPASTERGQGGSEEVRKGYLRMCWKTSNPVGNNFTVVGWDSFVVVTSAGYDLLR